MLALDLALSLTLRLIASKSLEGAGLLVDQNGVLTLVPIFMARLYVGRHCLWNYACQPQDCFHVLHDMGELTHGLAWQTLRLYSVVLRIRVAETVCAHAAPST